MEGSTIAAMYFQALSKHYDFSLDTPIKDLPKKILDILLYGTKGRKSASSARANTAAASI